MNILPFVSFVLEQMQKHRIFTASVVAGLTRVAADTQHRATVVTAQAVAVKQDAAKGVTFDDVHSLFAEITHVGRRGFPQDQRLGILQHHTHNKVQVHQ